VALLATPATLVTDSEPASSFHAAPAKATSKRAVGIPKGLQLDWPGLNGSPRSVQT
jgi:hypothetical protein